MSGRIELGCRLLSVKETRNILEATVLNKSCVTRNVKNLKSLRVKLKRSKVKGVSLYAQKLIRKNQVIAYYKFMVYSNSKYENPLDSTYTITVYNRKGKENPRLIGDIYLGSAPPPRGTIPYWAYFSNEPSPDQEENAYLDTDPKGNFRKRDRVKAGETMVYKLRALRNIQKGEEITWCYGEGYGRGYVANCD